MGSLSAKIFISRGISMNWRLRRWLDCWTYWRGENSDEGEVFSPYAQIWKAKTPPKVKIFVWQAGRGERGPSPPSLPFLSKVMGDVTEGRQSDAGGGLEPMAGT
ncbi:unnamed protein product [Prunus armeniaca]